MHPSDPAAQAPPRIDRADLRLRVATGLSAAVVVVAAIVVTHWGLFAFCLTLSLLAYDEFLRVTNTRRSMPPTWLCYAAVGLLWLGIGLGWTEHTLLFVGLFPALMVTMLFRDSVQHAFRDAAFLLFGLWYVVLPAYLLYQVAWHRGWTVFVPLAKSGAAYDWRVPLGILILVWANDIGGYFGGKLYGRRPLFPRISPKKTWEGFAGGLAFALAVAAGFQALFWGGLWGWPHQYALVAVVVVVGTLGDLVESMLKRGVGIKDSGGLLPGHGGLLDRFDGFLLAMPVAYLYLLLAS